MIIKVGSKIYQSIRRTKNQWCMCEDCAFNSEENKHCVNLMYALPNGSCTSHHIRGWKELLPTMILKKEKITVYKSYYYSE